MQMVKMFIRNASQKMSRWVHRGKLVRSIRPTDVFLVTYPKSGMMWVGFLLANIIHKMQSPSFHLSLEDFEIDKNRSVDKRNGFISPDKFKWEWSKLEHD